MVVTPNHPSHSTSLVLKPMVWGSPILGNPHIVRFPDYVFVKSLLLTRTMVQ